MGSRSGRQNVGHKQHTCLPPCVTLAEMGSILLPLYSHILYHGAAVNTVCPKMIKTINTKNVPMLEQDNIRQYLSCCVKLGMLNVELFRCDASQNSYPFPFFLSPLLFFLSSPSVASSPFSFPLFLLPLLFSLSSPSVASSLFPLLSFCCLFSFSVSSLSLGVHFFAFYNSVRV